MPTVDVRKEITYDDDDDNHFDYDKNFRLRQKLVVTTHERVKRILSIHLLLAPPTFFRSIILAIYFL